MITGKFSNFERLSLMIDVQKSKTLEVIFYLLPVKKYKLLKNKTC